MRDVGMKGRPLSVGPSAPRLAVGRNGEFGRTFRVPARWSPEVIGDTSIADVDFAEFACAVGGFRDVPRLRRRLNQPSPCGARYRAVAEQTWAGCRTGKAVKSLCFALLIPEGLLTAGGP